MSKTKSDRARPMPWLTYTPPAARDINRLVRGGPSERKLLMERQIRARLLTSSKLPEHQSLGRILSLGPQYSHMTAACPIQARQWQVYAASRMLKAFRGRGEVFMVTLGLAVRLTREQLLKFDVKKFCRRVRKQLQRKLVPGSIAFGVCEFSFDSEAKTFLPHFHIFVAGTPRRFLETLRPYYPADQGINMKHLMRVDPVTDLPRQLSYALKVNIFRRGKRTGKQRPQGKRLHVPFFRDHMLFLHRHVLSDFVICLGTRLHSRPPLPEVWLRPKRRRAGVLRLRS